MSQRVAAAALSLFFISPSVAIEFPFAIQPHGTNRYKLPAKTEALFVRRYGQHVPDRYDASEMENHEYALIFGGRFRPKLQSPALAAGRVLSGGRLSTIRPVLIDPRRSYGTSDLPDLVVGAIKDREPAQFSFEVTDSSFHPVFEVVANRVGSSLDPVLRIIDENGRELAYSDDAPHAQRDARLTFVPPRPGIYRLFVSDVSNSGGDDYFFALRSEVKRIDRSDRYVDYEPPPLFAFLSETRELPPGEDKEPNDSSNDAELLNIPGQTSGAFQTANDKDWFEFKVAANQKLILSAKTRRWGSGCDAALSLYDENGKLISESVGAAAEGPSITNRFGKAGSYRVQVREISRLGGPGFNYWFSIREAKPGVSLTTESERVEFSKEGEAKIKINCTRSDYDGPIALSVLSVDGLPEAVSFEDATVQEKKSEFELKLKRANATVPAFEIRIKGTINYADAKAEFPVSTMPALRKLFPLQIFPCAAMDGWIAVNPPPE